MNYYQHHIGDYRRDTAHLSLLEHGVYRQLLDMYYLSETKIPEETEVVYRRLCARTDDEKKAVDTILAEFFNRENGWVQTRCDKEIAEYQSKADRARINGKLGGRPPKTKEVISGNPEETKEKANHKPITINHKPIPPKPPADKSAGFDEFWSAYPKKAAKPQALKAWCKQSPPLDSVLEALAWQTKSEQWTKDGGQFIPLPASYLNAKRWDDERQTCAQKTERKFVC